MILKKANLMWVLLLILTVHCMGQDRITYSRPSKKTIAQIERSFKSTFKPNDPMNTIIINDAYIPNGSSMNLGQPKVFTRPFSWLLPGCEVSYFMTKKDSIVKLIMYDCVIKTGVKIIREKEKKIFDTLFMNISNKLGTPVTGGYEPTIQTDAERGSRTQHRITWKKDKKNVDLIMSWTKSNEIVWIRINVYWDN